MSESNVVKVIDKVVQQAQERYKEYVQSEYVATDIKVDGVLTKGQYKDRSESYTLKEEQTKTMTCMLDIDVHRGSLIEMSKDPTDKDFSMKGIVISVPSRTPVDFYFYTLFFNATVVRKRPMETFDSDGNIISDSPDELPDIPAFVQRIGTLERKIDAGIDRETTNQLITTKQYDIQVNDLIFVGDDKYRVTDIDVLDTDLLSLFMTYYRGDME